MELFYTVVSQEGLVQSKPELSLGGFCSGSKVPNGSLGNLFSEISAYFMQNPKAEYIGLILKNTFAESVKNLKFWMNVPENSICNFRIAIVELNSNGQMEHIPSVNSKPFYADFEVTSETDKIEIESEEPFASGQMLGIWIERTLNMDSDQVKNRNNCDVLFEMFEKNQKWPTEENVSLNVDFSMESGSSFNADFNNDYDN